MSCNWFGLLGLEKFCSSFKKFQNLQKLNLNNNKLCIEEDKDPRPLCALLQAVSHNLVELQLCENSMADPDLIDYVLPAVIEMKKLEHLNLSRNPLFRLGICSLFFAMFENGICLKTFNITGSQLKDDGLEELLPLVLKMPSIKSLNLTACKLTEKSADSFASFLDLYATQGLIIDLKLQNVNRKSQASWKKSIRKANKTSIIKF